MDSLHIQDRAHVHLNINQIYDQEELVNNQLLGDPCLYTIFQTLDDAIHLLSKLFLDRCPIVLKYSLSIHTFYFLPQCTMAHLNKLCLSNSTYLNHENGKVLLFLYAFYQFFHKNNYCI